MVHTVKQRDHYRQVLRLISGIGRLTNPQHLPALRRRRVSLGQLLALDGLGEAPRPLRMSELAGVAGLALPELTRVVAGLEANGWVKRRTDPDDSRAKLVELTGPGRNLVEQVHREAMAGLREVWTDFTHDEWHRLIDFLNRFESGLRRVRAGNSEIQAVPGGKTPCRSRRKPV